MEEKEFLVFFGERRTVVKVPKDGTSQDIVTAAITQFGSESVSRRPLLQLWSAKWDSWVDITEDQVLPDMSKIKLIPQTETSSEVGH
jgi:hypothetical protein